MTKILNVKIKDDGDFVEIETDNENDYKYIWIIADDVEIIANFAELI